MPTGVFRSSARLAGATGMAAAAVLLTAAGAVVPAAGTVGDPQPELAPFGVGPAGGNGSGAVLSGSWMVLAAASTSGATIHVCTLKPGARKCSFGIVTLPAFKGDTFFGTPEVLTTGSGKVSIVAEDCCLIGANGVVSFSSVNGGHTFGPEKIVGSINGIGAGTVADGQLVVANNGSGSFNVQAFPPNPASPQTTAATPNSAVVGTSALTTYQGGVLVANDDVTNTRVEFAKSGSDFNSSASYKHIATFPNEQTVAVSGSALLTDPHGSLTGGERLRFFNGTSFGKSFKVPDTKLGDDGYFAMQDVGGTVHVFFEGRRNNYDLFEETTRNGVHWSPLRRYRTAINSTQLVPVLNKIGAGLVFEASSARGLIAQPILNPQQVHITLEHFHVLPGHSTKLTGSAKPRLNNQLVTLERLKGKVWYKVKTTHESAVGKFSFTVPGITRTYRVVVANQPGFYQFGYSNRVTLTA